MTLRSGMRSYRWAALAMCGVFAVTASYAAPRTGRGSAGVVEEQSVAITFDDLPFVFEGNGKDASKAARHTNTAILSALRRYHAPATGFVIETSVQRLGPLGPKLLRQWNSGAYRLGNHSFSHADSNDLDLAGVETEVIKGEATIGPLAASAGRRLHFFRFPMNHVGNSDTKRIGISAILNKHGYRLAASTIDTSDYIFNQAYENALARRDGDAIRKIECSYVAYTRQQIAYYRRLDRTVMGRAVPAVMLLHLSSLNAATITKILDLFSRSGYRFVTLDEAQADPAYDHDPVVTTRFGPMWGYRWACERHVRVDGSLEQEPPSWIANYAAGHAISPKIAR